MITECQCDMPIWAYHDWLQEQGWNTEGLEEEEIAITFLTFMDTKFHGCGIRYNSEYGHGIDYQLNYENDSSSNGMYKYKFQYTDEAATEGYEDVWVDSSSGDGNGEGLYYEGLEDE